MPLPVFLSLFSLAPLALGGFIYLGWRTPNLHLFRWFDLIGLSVSIEKLRASTPAIPLPDWVLYNLPDGLWVFAATCAVGAPWAAKRSSEARFWRLSPLAFALLTELGQGVALFPGTFSAGDVLAYLLGSFLALHVLKLFLEPDSAPST